MIKGQKMSDEARQHMREAKLRNPVRYWKGKHISEEHNKKMQEGKNKKAPTPRLGMPFTDESKKKISTTLKKKYKNGSIKHWNTGNHVYDYSDFKKEVHERDQYICRFCKKPGGWLEVDHIRPRKTHPQLVLDMSNVRTLCVDCHKRVTFGWKPEMDFRRAFMNALLDLARTDERIVFNTNDVGFSFLENWQQEFPDRYFNFGVTENSSAIISAGMALSGLRPVLYSMINFVLYRPFEMVRNAICYHNAPVLLAGVQGSIKYKMLGFSHTSSINEDVNLIDTLPNIRIYIPLDEREIPHMVKKIFSENYPAYIRL